MQRTMLYCLIGVGLIGCVTHKNTKTVNPQQTNTKTVANTTTNTHATAPTPTTAIPAAVSVPVNPVNIGSRLSADEVSTLLSLHNQSRAEVGVSEITWSSAAAKYVQMWLDKLAASSCSLQHNPDRQYGENLFMGTVGFYGVGDAVKAWANEKQYYHGEAISSANFTQFGHYTQMVWRNSTEVGCAKSVCGSSLIVGCNYNPAGNYQGQKPY